jgi:hypothetical protein
MNVYKTATAGGIQKSAWAVEDLEAIGPRFAPKATPISQIEANHPQLAQALQEMWAKMAPLSAIPNVK